MYRLYAFLQRSILFATTLPPVAYLLVSVMVFHPAALTLAAFLTTLVGPIFFVMIVTSVLFDILGPWIVPEEFQIPTWIGILIAWTLFFIWAL